MLAIDLFTTYIVCGGAFVAAACMLLWSRVDEDHQQAALRQVAAGYALAGASLLAMLPGSGDRQSVVNLIALVGMVAGGTTSAWGYARLAGFRWRPKPMLAAAVIFCLLAVAAVPAGSIAITATFVAQCALLSTISAACWIWPRRELASRPAQALKVALLINATVWILRLGYTLTHQGPELDHGLYVPEALRPWMALWWAVAPVLYASLLQATVIEQLHQRLRLRALTDELTGLLGRRAFNEQAPAVVAAARGRHQAVAAVLLDLDHFKRINDEHGHAAGDQVLRLAGQALKRPLRSEALVARYGGEEFVALLPVDDMASGRRVAERLREALAGVPWATAVNPQVQVTASAGVALLREDESLEQALTRADAALYRAKAAGRDQVQVELAAA